MFRMGEEVKETTIHDVIMDEKTYGNIMKEARDNKKVELTKENTIYRGFIRQISMFHSDMLGKGVVDITFIDAEVIEKACETCEYNLPYRKKHGIKVSDTFCIDNCLNGSKFKKRKKEKNQVEMFKLCENCEYAFDSSAKEPCKSCHRNFKPKKEKKTFKDLPTIYTPIKNIQLRCENCEFYGEVLHERCDLCLDYHNFKPKEIKKELKQKEVSKMGVQEEIKKVQKKIEEKEKVIEGILDKRRDLIKIIRVNWYLFFNNSFKEWYYFNKDLSSFLELGKKERKLLGKFRIWYPQGSNRNSLRYKKDKNFYELNETWNEVRGILEKIVKNLDLYKLKKLREKCKRIKCYADKNICSACKSELQKEDKFCWSCGRRVE